VVGALQDPRKDVISLRNLFSTRIALRLDESDQVGMVLGDGARDRGALADQISPDPWTGARVRAAYVTDDDINAMVAAVTGGGDAW
jgi:S-DNA-T family DNA segregation ATPase FtsK/SpoIIIE